MSTARVMDSSDRKESRPTSGRSGPATRRQRAGTRAPCRRPLARALATLHRRGLGGDVEHRDGARIAECWGRGHRVVTVALTLGCRCVVECSPLELGRRAVWERRFANIGPRTHPYPGHLVRISGPAPHAVAGAASAGRLTARMTPTHPEWRCAATIRSQSSLLAISGSAFVMASACSAAMAAGPSVSDQQRSDSE